MHNFNEMFIQFAAEKKTCNVNSLQHFCTKQVLSLMHLNYSCVRVNVGTEISFMKFEIAGNYIVMWRCNK